MAKFEKKDKTAKVQPGPQAPRDGIRVRAVGPAGTVVGYYNLRRMRAGDTFTIKSEKEFSKRWMEKVDAKTAPAKVDEQSDEGQDVDQANAQHVL